MNVRTLDPAALAARARSVGPWTADNVVGLLVANGLGTAMLVAGWWQATRQDTANGRIGWLDLSVAGLIVAGGGNGLWLARGRRAVRLAAAEVSARWSALAAVAAVPSSPAPVVDGDGLVALPGAQRYHRSSCLLAVGKDVVVLERRRHESAARRPCEVCEP